MSQLHNYILQHEKKVRWILIALVLLLAFVSRVWRLDTQPPGLYWEEAALGYDAFSIAQTGRDHHGHWFPIVAFESFGDWKPSLYFYSIVPFIWLLGLTEWAVRLPSAVAGVATVVGVGLLTHETLIREPQPKKQTWLWQLLPLLSMLLTAISPWAILFSRGGWEVNLATALLVYGVVLGMIFERKKTFWSMLATVTCLGLSMYAYHAARVIAPLLGLGLFTWWLRSQPQVLLKKHAKSMMISGFVIFVLLLPMIGQLGSKQTTQRYAETALLADSQYILRSNQLRDLDNNTLVSRVLYHRYVIYAEAILQNALSHFEIGFLFLHGDANPRHSVQLMGQLYHIELIFLILGLGWWFQSRGQTKWLGLWWLFLGVLPAAITQAAPHALRTLPLLPLYMVTITLGLWHSVWWLQSKVPAVFMTAVVGFIMLVYAAEWWRFQVIYWRIYPQTYGQEWQVGTKQTMQQLSQKLSQHPDWTAEISRAQGRPAMFYWFYNKIDPQLVQAAAQTVPQDQGELLQFQNITFGSNTSSQETPNITAEWTATTGWQVTTP